MNTMRTLLIGGLAASLLVPTPLEAQRRPQGRRGQGLDRQELEQRVRERMGRMMEERLGLTEEEAQSLSEVMEGFQGQRRELAAQERDTRRQVEALIRDGGGDQEVAQALLERMVDLRTQEAELFRLEQERLLEVLTPAQVLQLQSLRDELGRRIRSLRRGRGDGGRP